MLKKLALLTSASLFAFATAAFAMDAKFETTDVDGNGEVTFDEGVAVHADWTEAAFAELDADGNGTLSKEEYEAAL